MIDWRLAVGLPMESFMVGPWPSHAPMLTHPWWNNGEGMLMSWLMHGLWLAHGEHPRAKWNFAGHPRAPTQCCVVQLAEAASVIANIAVGCGETIAKFHFARGWRSVCRLCTKRHALSLWGVSPHHCTKAA